MTTTEEILESIQALVARNSELIDTLKEAMDAGDEATAEVAISELELNNNALVDGVSRLTPMDPVSDEPNATQPI
jgi:predicted transcriptional regulator